MNFILLKISKIKLLKILFKTEMKENISKFKIILMLNNNVLSINNYLKINIKIKLSINQFPITD